MGKATRKTMTLEEYEQFLEDPHKQALTIFQLNRMINMHGFMKIHRRPKQELYGALSTINLIKLQRSTLKDAFSPNDDSSLSLDQVRQDLEALNWQECIIQSIESISANDRSPPKGDSVILKPDLDISASSFKNSRKRQKRKRKRETEGIADDIGASHGNTALAVDMEATGCVDVTAAGATQCDSSLYVHTCSWDS